MKDLHHKNVKGKRNDSKEIGENTRKEEASHVNGKQNIVKMTKLLKVIYGFNTILLRFH